MTSYRWVDSQRKFIDLMKSSVSRSGAVKTRSSEQILQEHAKTELRRGVQANVIRTLHHALLISGAHLQAIFNLLQASCIDLIVELCSPLANPEPH